MADLRYIALWVDPDVDNLVGRFQEAAEGASLRFEKSKTAEHALDRLTYDNPQVDVILLGSIFGDPSKPGEFGLLDTIRQMDPDVPVFLITDQNDAELHRAAGRASVEVMAARDLCASGESSFVERVKKAAEASASPTYDIEQRKLANRVASKYEEMECKGPGTVAYWLFEEDLIEKIVTQKKNSLGRDRKVEVLDVGCGDGRFARVF